ncbi:uncharacterized protein BKA55DRAFT_586149 [Fusarium redolens]|uniref:Uncharacterized protein n=1 Tax=Fusarium redolens TaxID=48865 RepID=A0A9P9FVI7_FUSRE|nr:uncharacterized protein BKA55DRAFT_586149 [Fusarium redolens]KAH7208470.1 hypothetical protein BKA55DRAFT_586149 [Fusarium redolens]
MLQSESSSSSESNSRYRAQSPSPGCESSSRKRQRHSRQASTPNRHQIRSQLSVLGVGRTTGVRASGRKTQPSIRRRRSQWSYETATKRFFLQSRK